MLKQKFAALLATAAALALLTVPAFAEDAPAALPEAEPAAVQEEVAAPEETSAPETDPVAAQEETALPADAQTPDEPAEEHQFTYVALGDSVTAGVGLSGVQSRNTDAGLDLSPNFEGYPSQCYVALVADGLGLDRQHAIDLGLSGLKSGDLLELVQTGKASASGAWDYPQFREYLQQADAITVLIGANDATVTAFAALGDATHWKSEQLVDVVVNGTMRDPSPENIRRLNESLSKLMLTKEEIQAVNQLLFQGGTDAICEQAYQDVSTNLPQIVAELRALNPDAQIILMGYMNPVPLLPEWTQYFNRLNDLGKTLAQQNENVSFVSFPLTMTASDGHPTVLGHRYIAKRLLKAMK